MNGQSSGFLTPNLHLDEYPLVTFFEPKSVKTTKFSSLNVLSEDHQRVFCNLDIQGAELLALRGFGRELNKVDYVYCEVNTRELYENCSQINELDEFLLDQGLVRVDLKMTRHGWGDALYVRSSVLPRFLRVRRSLRQLYGNYEIFVHLVQRLLTKVRGKIL